MSYLEKFHLLLDEEKLAPVLHLWEEYCMGDEVNGEELYLLLKMFKESPYGPAFGHLVETALPMWEKIKDEEIGDNILRLVIDLQTTHALRPRRAPPLERRRRAPTRTDLWRPESRPSQANASNQNQLQPFVPHLPRPGEERRIDTSTRSGGRPGRELRS